MVLILHIPSFKTSSDCLSAVSCTCLCTFPLQCGPGGCLIELAQQLFIIMVGKQFINNVQEFVIPYVSSSNQLFGYHLVNIMYFYATFRSYRD